MKPLILLVALLALAGCGGDPGPKEASPEATDAATVDSVVAADSL